MNNNATKKQEIFNFFEQPESVLAKVVQFFIFILIILSVVFFYIEYFEKALFLEYKSLFIFAEYIILAVFTSEYLIRLYAAPKKIKWALKPFSIVDFLAVFPSLLELVLPLFINTSGVRAFRLIRILRFSRLLRILKMFRYGKMLQKLLSWQGTILQAIMPAITFFTLVKSIVWILEHYGLWIPDTNLGELFAIIGFALGIILAQKIAASYDKFLIVEGKIIELYGTLTALANVINKVKPGLGTKHCQDWAKSFLTLISDSNSNNYDINKANMKLYDVIKEVEESPSELAILYSDISKTAAYCLSLKIRLTPEPYDTLLSRSTMLYLFMIAIFIPGITGMISVLIAVYILYGMYNLTQDLDSIVGGEYNLINIDISELEYFANKKD